MEKYYTFSEDLFSEAPKEDEEGLWTVTYFKPSSGKKIKFVYTAKPEFVQIVKDSQRAETYIRKFL